MEQLLPDLLKILITILLSMLGYIWTTTLRRIQTEWTQLLKDMKADIKDIKTAINKHDKRLDDLERFRVAITTIHNINHPNTKINGLGANGTVSKP